MMKILVLQSLYSLSDPEVERQVLDRISFRRFIGFSEKVPDFSTVWKFKERLIQNGKEKELWDAFQQQLNLKGLEVRKGVIQDASIIPAESGKSKGERSRGEEAKTRRSKDGTWTKKGKKSYFGYKVHTKMDYEHSLIRDVKTTTASVHDSQVDLSQPGEVVYRDKGYFGVTPQGFDATMKRGVRGHPITSSDQERNKRIMRKRARCERPYAMINDVFHLSVVKVTTVARVHLKMLFACMNFNLHQLKTLASFHPG
jgi:IS5 family transposase